MYMVDPDDGLCDLTGGAYASTNYFGWHDHSNFGWGDQNQWPQPQPQAYDYPNQHQSQGVWNHDYWPPHQSGFSLEFSPQNQGQWESNHPSKQEKTLEEKLEDLIASQQYMQNNFQARNDVFHELHDAQWDQNAQDQGQWQSIHTPKQQRTLEERLEDLIASQQIMQDAQHDQILSIDMLTRQVTQLVISTGDMCENGGEILTEVQPPRKETLNQIASRSGKELKASLNNNSDNGSGETSEQESRMPSAANCPRHPSCPS